MSDESAELIDEIQVLMLHVFWADEHGIEVREQHRDQLSDPPHFGDVSTDPQTVYSPLDCWRVPEHRLDG